MGSSIIIENTWISLHFHYFLGGAESVRSSRIIENPKLSLHFHHFLGGTESVGSSGINETHMDFNAFPLFLLWSGERG